MSTERSRHPRRRRKLRRLRWRWLRAGRLVAALLFALPAHGEPPDRHEADADRDAMLLAYFEVWSSGELERLDAIVAPDFRRHGGPDESCASLDELKRLIARARTIYERLRITVDDSMTEERGGAMRGSFYGVHAEVGRVVEFPLMSMVRFEDGRIAEEWTLGNNFLPLVGLGYQLTPPGFEVIRGPEGGR